MSSQEEYEAKLEIINAIPVDQIEAPIMPVEAYIQEAEKLILWSAKDQEKLVSIGLNWELATDIPARAGALRQAETIWTHERFDKSDAIRLWQDTAPGAYDLRDELLRIFRFAFRDRDDLLRKVAVAADGSTNADMIQDLNDLSYLGKQNVDLFTAVGCDVTLLDLAAQKADELAPLLAAASGERAETSPSKRIRDRAFTHLKQAVDEIFKFGRFAFWGDEERLKGYRSEYLRQQRLARERKDDAAQGNGDIDDSDR